VIDVSAESAPGTDVACAALGVPYLGPSGVWPPLPGSPLAAARLLLTDAGLSTRRRGHALAALEQAGGEKTIADIRALALAGQPDPEAAAARRPPPTVAPDMETMIVRLRPGAGAAERTTLGQFVTALGGLVLMVTSVGSLVVLAPNPDKEKIEAHPLVELVGGISLDDDAPGALSLKKHFAENAMRQLEQRRAGGTAEAPSANR
jgi:hypothetical protein